MRSLVPLTPFVPLLAVATGCADTHSIRPPRKPNAEARVDVGPIVDQSGVDVGPVVASRIRECRLGDAHYVSAQGENPYVSGRIRVEKGESGNSAAAEGGALLFATGLTGVILGGTFFGLGAGLKEDSLKSTGLAVGLISAAVTAAGIFLLTQPSRYREGTVTASLDAKRGATSTPIEVKDEANVHHSIHRDEEAGGPMLDGVANAISKETSKQPVSARSTSPAPAP